MRVRIKQKFWERSHVWRLIMTRLRIRISWLAILLSGGVSIGYCGVDARAATVVLDPNGVTQIPVGSGYVTTVLFPRPVPGIVGYGLTSDPASQDVWIHNAHPGASVLVTSPRLT